MNLLEEEEKKKHIYPVLIVDNLPKSFGVIEKRDNVKAQKLSKEEKILLTLVARVFIEITLNEEL